MKKYIFYILFFYCCLPVFSQRNDLTNTIIRIKELKGDSVARNYLESKKDSLDQIGETSSYLLLWGLLTSNMWNTSPTETLKKEYREFLDALINNEIREEMKDDGYVPSLDMLSPLWTLTSDYYKLLYNEGDKESALFFLKCIHKWFAPYTEARNTIGYAQSLLDLCVVLIRDMHNYKEGESFCKEYVDVSKTVYGESSKQHAIALYNLAVIPNLNRNEQLILIKKAINIYESVTNNDDALLQQMKNDYDMLTAMHSGIPTIEETSSDNDVIPIAKCTQLVMAGRGNEALKSLLYHKQTILKEEYLDKLMYFSIVQLIINAYIQMGDYSAATKEYSDFPIKFDELPPEYVQMSYQTAGLLFFYLKDYTKSIACSQEAIKLYDKAGNFGVEYIQTLANLALAYAMSGEYLDSQFYLDAKWYIDEAISLFEERVGPLLEHGNIGINLLRNKTSVYSEIGDIDEAILTLEEIVERYSNNDNLREEWILCVNNLSALYMKKGRWEDGAKLLGNISSYNDEVNYLIAQNLAICHLYAGNKSECVSDIKNMTRFSLKNIENIFSYFTGNEREKYWDRISKELIMVDNLIAYHTGDSQATAIAFNNTLLCKNLLLNHNRLVDSFVSQSTDQELKEQYAYYKQLRSKLAFKSVNVSNKDSITNLLSHLERYIIAAAGSINQWLNKTTKSWEEVKQSLDEHEIAIEYCYAPRMEKYPDLEPYYGAFLLRNDFDYPILVSLENVDVVENVFDNDNPDELFVNELYSHDKSITLHRMLWEKIAPYLNGIKTVYYSPTGRLPNVNFDVLYGEDGKMLGEKYSMVRVSTTANISGIKELKKSKLQSSVLYGNIKYDESPTEMAAASAMYDEFSGSSIQTELALRSVNERGKWGPIPSTKIEIDNIGSLFSNNKIEVSKYEGNAGSEESFKALSGQSPDIIHLATHGFVIDSKERIEDNKFVASTTIYSQQDSYMMWAGLMLAGGNNIWQGNFNLINVEDGILTADEISRLDLSNTKLVVLSACETARGKIDPVNGVYGLQRAFKMAGVGTIIMSLWKVQDDATSLLMTQFYSYFTNGIDKHLALWKAMMDVKDKYKDPYYWAGFIMLD